MQNRVSKHQIVFQHPFILSEIGRELPAGPYTIETVEAPVESASFVTYQPISTIIVYRRAGVRDKRHSFWEIDPMGLASAQERDRRRVD